jgi:hypothetical protein
VNLPQGGEVVIRDLFHTFTGRFPYHCHILNHEDNGMMLVVDVVGPGGRSARPSGPDTGHGAALITGEAH